jgi:glycosyltransferase involved in cell wall biosynthesis
MADIINCLMSSIKCLYIITRLDRGGSAEVVLQWAEGLQKRGFQITIISGRTDNPERDLSAFASRTGIPLVMFPSLQREVQPFSDIKALVILYRYIKKAKPDIVHTHTSKAGFLGRIAAKLNRVPVIIHSTHGHIFYGYYGRLKTKLFILMEKFAGNFTDCITELTQLGIEDHIKLKIAPRDKFVVLRAGIDLTQYRSPQKNREQMRQEFSLPVEAFVVGWVGRMTDIKNPLLLVKTAEILKNKSSLRFLMAGGGELLEPAKELAIQLNIVDKIIFTGHRNDIPNILTAVDIYVLTSRNEGLGRSILEAQAAGITVIATNVGGVPEIVTDGETGILVPANNPSALAEAIVKLTFHPELRVKLSQKALQNLGAFSLEKSLNDLEHLYNTFHHSRDGYHFSA